MNVTEEVLAIRCGAETLFGVLARPAQRASRDVAVVIVVGGPQYRVGAHRQFVLLARRLAAHGWPVLRFDVRGMGDSGGDRPPFDAAGDDIAAAIRSLLQAAAGVRRVVLWGLCDGASAALLYGGARADAGIAGLCLLNPWVRSAPSMARTHLRHYYAKRLVSAAFWRKLLKGDVGWRAWFGFVDSARLALDAAPAPAGAPADFRDAMAAAWQRFGGPILLLVSADDLTAREFDDALRTDARWRGALARPAVERLPLAGADHTLSRAVDRQAAESAVLAWLDARFAASPSALAVPEAAEQTT